MKKFFWLFSETRCMSKIKSPAWCTRAERRTAWIRGPRGRCAGFPGWRHSRCPGSRCWWACEDIRQVALPAVEPATSDGPTSCRWCSSLPLSQRRSMENWLEKRKVFRKLSALVRGDSLRIYGKALRFLKLESSRQPTVKIWWSHLAPFLTNPPVWQTDRQTNRQNCDG